MKLFLYPTSGEPPKIRPAPSQREWMDETPQSFAYRCLPLTIANSNGWEVLNPCAFRARWKGGHSPNSIEIESDPDRPNAPLSHFGSGILTFHVNALIRTEPGYDLWVGGPVNQPKDGIQALTGIIETDWSPYSFTMNWRFTREHHWVGFEEGEPFLHFFPVPRGLVEEVEPEIRDMASDPDTMAAYRNWTEGRNAFLKNLQVPGSQEQREKWQKAYYRGLRPDDRPGVGDHRIKLRVKPFERA